MLKLLAILTNILVSNLVALKSYGLDPASFIGLLVQSLSRLNCSEIKLQLHSLANKIPSSTSSDTLEKSALSYGCSLLKELAFKFLTYTQDEVSDGALKRLLLSEYVQIISA